MTSNYTPCGQVERRQPVLAAYVHPGSSVNEGFDCVRVGVAGGVVQGGELVRIQLVDAPPPLLPQAREGSFQEPLVAITSQLGRGSDIILHKI